MTARLFDVVFVRPPSDSYVNCISSSPRKSEIDLVLARRQHQKYASALKREGIRVVTLPPLEKFPDSVFMQDPAVVGTKYVIFGRFAAPSRRGEEESFRTELDNHVSGSADRVTITAPGCLEGGDVLVTDRGLFIGESMRTNSDGIEQLQNAMAGVEILAVKTKLLHLLSACSYLGDGNMMIVPELVDPDNFPGFKLIPIPEDESYACNALHIGERKVVVPSGYPETRNRLKKAGYSPIELDMSEFCKGDGGVTCLSSPIYKVF